MGWPSSSLALMLISLLTILLAISGLAMGQQRSKILVMTNHESGSHQRSMAPFIQRLCQSGHSVFLLDTIGPQRQSEFMPKCVQILRIEIGQNMAQNIGYQLANKVDEQQIREARAAMCFNETYRSRFMKNIQKNWDVGILGQLAVDHSREFANLLSTHWDMLLIDDWFCVHCNAIANFLHSQGSTKYAIFATTWPFHSAASATATSWLSFSA